MARPRSWDDEDLRRAVAVATSWADVCRALDLAVGGDAFRRLRRRCHQIHLDVSRITSDPDGFKRHVERVVEGTA